MTKRSETVLLRPEMSKLMAKMAELAVGDFDLFACHFKDMILVSSILLKISRHGYVKFSIF